MDENVNSCSGYSVVLMHFIWPTANAAIKMCYKCTSSSSWDHCTGSQVPEDCPSGEEQCARFLSQAYDPVFGSKVVRQRVYAKELKLPKCVTIFDGETLERELAVKSSVPLEISQTKKSHQVLIKRVFHSKIESFYPRMSPSHFSAFMAFVSVRLLVTFVLK